MGNSSSMMESITCQPDDQNGDHNQPTIETSANTKLENSSPTNAPFRKKAITSIERTRKLSILLKHQQYLVSAIKSFTYIGIILFYEIVKSLFTLITI